MLEQLDVIGVLCVEFFLTREGELLVNEVAPRPHNSGHLTIDACVTSQFEQQLRPCADCRWAAPRCLRPAAMANLSGRSLDRRRTGLERRAGVPVVKLHLYGKTEARPGRKMGHLTATAETTTEAERMVRAARSKLAH